MKTLYLIDGHAAFFRAYYAIRGGMNSPVTGEPTNAVYGFISMLFKLLREEKPDYLAVVIDVGGDKATFRSEIYPEYKANRDAPPEDFHPQVERCLELCQAMNLPVLSAPGFEADDVIAALADRLPGEDLHVRIVSKDKDLMQLLGPHVDMFDSTKSTIINAETLHETLGITPDQVVDVLTLAGDTVDNVPGVPGIGMKTAAQLISRFGSLDDLLEHIDTLKGKRREKILQARDLLPLSRELVTLRRDLDVDLDLSEASVKPPAVNEESVDKLFRELGFNRFRDDLKALLSGENSSQKSAESTGENAAAKGTRRKNKSSKDDGQAGLFDAHAASDPEQTGTLSFDTSAGDYQLITTKKQLAELVKQLQAAEIIAVDTETDSLAPRSANLCGISFSVKPGTGVYIPVRSPEPDRHLDQQTVIETLRPVLEDPDKPKVGHNLKFDIQIFRRADVKLAGVAFDTMIASYVIDASRPSHKLDHLALALLGHRCTPLTDLIGPRSKKKVQKTFDQLPLDVAGPYAAEDADITLQLQVLFQPQLKALKLTRLFTETEMPLVEVLAELEWNGIRVDPDELQRQAKDLRARIEELKIRIQEESPRPFNPDSPKQLATILFNSPDDSEPGLGLKPIKKTKTGYSTDVEVLQKLSENPDVITPVPALMVEYRNLTKLVNTYLTSLVDAINPCTGRIHASFNQTVAVTGRLSSSDPNLQNIPIRTETGRAVRKAFLAEDGCRLISADYSQIELRVLAHMSEDPALVEAFQQDMDIHTAVAAQVFDVKPSEVTREQRSGAKMVNFGIVYGITPYGLARRLGSHPDGKPWEVDEAAQIINSYKERFARIDAFLQQCIEKAKKDGYVETILGRRRAIPQVHARSGQQRALGERLAINTVVQGSAADLIKIAMINLYRELPDVCREAKMLLQIHDELVFECPENEVETVMPYIVRRMEEAMTLRVPLKVDAAASKTWYEGK